MLDVIIIFIVSFAILAKASEYVIDSAIDITKILGVSEFATGFLLLSVATSIPELFVSATASLTGNSGIAIGNVIGANIADIAWVLGATAIVGLVTFTKKRAAKNAAILFLVSLIPLVLMTKGVLSSTDGLVLLLIFFIYCFFVSKTEFVGTKKQAGANSTLKAVAVFIISIAVVVFSAHLIVQSGVKIAELFNIPPVFIGLSIISIGTTLPELSVNLTAVRKKKLSLAVGNILGSCVTNLTLVLGTAAVINPIEIETVIPISSILFLIALNLFLWFNVRRGRLTRTSGVAMIMAYILFMAFEAGMISL